MTLEFFKDNQELMSQCVLWWQGRDQTTTGFPILPSGVTATPAGTWANDLSLGNNKMVKTFDGSGNYLTMSNTSSVNFGADDFTIALWSKFISTPSAASTIIAILQTYTGEYGLDIFRPSSREIVLNASYSGTAWDISNLGVSPALSNNIWYHIVIIRSAGYLKSYINSEYKYQYNIGLNSLVASTGNWMIGALRPANLYPHNGSMKDLIIYKGRALTQVEITTLMRMTNPNTGREFELLYPGQRGVE